MLVGVSPASILGFMEDLRCARCTLESRIHVLPPRRLFAIRDPAIHCKNTLGMFIVFTLRVD